MLAGPDRRDLTASHWTLAGAQVGQRARWPLSQRLRAARAAGFNSVGLLLDEYRHWIRTGRTDGELRSLLEGADVAIGEVEFLFGWTESDQPSETEAWAHRLADAVGPFRLNTGELAPPTPGREPSLDELVERFRGICDRAAPHPITVALEFVPWTVVDSLATAAKIVEDADRSNGGLMIDAWHLFAAGGDVDAFPVLDPASIVSVQLADGYRSREVSPAETTHSRALPGSADFDLVSFVQHLDQAGVECPVTVEIMSDRHAGRELDRAARLAHESSADVLDRAGDPRDHLASRRGASR